MLLCPDPECFTTYDTIDDPDTAFELMVNHYRYNLRHQGFGSGGRGVIGSEEAAMAVVKRNTVPE